MIDVVTMTVLIQVIKLLRIQKGQPPDQGIKKNQTSYSKRIIICSFMCCIDYKNGKKKGG